MSLDEQLSYKAYEHMYKKDDILSLKSIEGLNEINNVLNADRDIDVDANVVKWYLTKERIEALSSKKFEVLNCISWHMGIPYYILMDMEDQSSAHDVAEFYLKKL